MWHLMDTSRNVVVATRVERADSMLARMKGLLGRDGLAPEEGLWIEPCNSIHMFFMRFPIDVAFVDRQGVVVKCIDTIRPWRATRIYAKAVACVELPAGLLARKGVVEGSRLVLVAAEKS